MIIDHHDPNSWVQKPAQNLTRVVPVQKAGNFHHKDKDHYKDYDQDLDNFHLSAQATYWAV